MNLSILTSFLFSFFNLFYLTGGMYRGNRQGYGYNGEGSVPPRNNQPNRQREGLPRGYQHYGFNRDEGPTPAELALFYRHQNFNRNHHNGNERAEVIEHSYPASDDESENNTTGNNNFGYGNREANPGYDRPSGGNAHRQPGGPSGNSRHGEVSGHGFYEGGSGYGHSEGQSGHRSHGESSYSRDGHGSGYERHGGGSSYRRDDEGSDDEANDDHGFSS